MMKAEKTEILISNTVSWLFNPIFLPLYTIVLLFQQDYYFVMILTPQAKWFITLLIAINTILIPGLLLVFFQWRGFISSLHLHKREERYLPYIMMAVFYFLTHYLISELKLPDIFYIYITGATALVILILIINFFWKISVHMSAMGAIAGAFTGMAVVYSLPVLHLLVWLLLAGGVTGYARLRLKAHTPAQIYSGYLVGFFVLFVSFTLF